MAILDFSDNSYRSMLTTVKQIIKDMRSCNAAIKYEFITENSQQAGKLISLLKAKKLKVFLSSCGKKIKTVIE